MDSVENKVHAVERMAHAVGDRAKSYVDRGVSAVDTVSGKTLHYRHDADTYLRDNAWVAIGAAAGLGLVIGFMLRGHHHC